jgi:phosphoribosylamine--glycine ligase
MKLLIIGSGAREHALVWKLSRPAGSEVVAAPGNPGIAGIARCLPVDPNNPQAVLEAARQENPDLTVVGPEAPLARGVADLFLTTGRPLLGPTRGAARLETSKAFAKDFMARHGVPTARFEICGTAEEALAHVDRETLSFPLVIKADGLAAGKGVVIAPDRASAQAAIDMMMVKRQFGEAGATLVLEEHLTGREVSFFALCDGSRAATLVAAEDYKRVHDEDRGPNTGGMGAFAPSGLIDAAAGETIMKEIIRPVLAGMRADGGEFRGFLYAGLMMTASGPRVIEFNVRLGDPEAQVVLPMMDDDFASHLLAAATGRLDTAELAGDIQPHVGVVLASGGYPGEFQIGKPITGLEKAQARENVVVFHAGTREADGQLVTAGGRVLTVVGRGRTFEEAARRAYDAADCIQFENRHLRRDIGRKARD